MALPEIRARERPAGPWTPDEVIAGLYAPRKHLPRATSVVPVAALAQLEVALLHRYAPQIALHVGPEPRVLEIGGGELATTRALIAAIERPSGYVVADQRDRSPLALRQAFPGLDVQSVHADYLRPFDLPVPQHEWRRTLVYVGGATFGAFEPGEVRALLAGLARVVGPDRMLLLGADATRDPGALAETYGDERLTKGVLAELNRARGATFDLDGFEHRAEWNGEASRVELALVSTRRQVVRIAGTPVVVAAGDVIRVRHCYQHTPMATQALLGAAGWRSRQVFTATHLPYRLWLCEPSRE